MSAFDNVVNRRLVGNSLSGNPTVKTNFVVMVLRPIEDPSSFWVMPEFTTYLSESLSLCLIVTTLLICVALIFPNR